MCMGERVLFALCVLVCVCVWVRTRAICAVCVVCAMCDACVQFVMRVRVRVLFSIAHLCWSVCVCVCLGVYVCVCVCVYVFVLFLFYISSEQT